MTNDEFQKLVLEQLSVLRTDIVDIKQRQFNMEINLKDMDVRQKNMEVHLNDIDSHLNDIDSHLNDIDSHLNDIDSHLNDIDVSQKNMEVRQDEIYQVVKAIEHSNQVGKAELDTHEFRIAKMEGKFKKAGKIFDTDEIDTASNL